MKTRTRLFLVLGLALLAAIIILSLFLALKHDPGSGAITGLGVVAVTATAAALSGGKKNAVEAATQDEKTILSTPASVVADSVPGVRPIIDAGIATADAAIRAGSNPGSGNSGGGSPSLGDATAELLGGAVGPSADSGTKTS